MANGLVEYALGGVSYDTPVGIITGGRYGQDVNAEKRSGVGGVGTWKPTRHDPSVRLDYLPVDVNGLLTSILRASYPDSQPTSIPLEVGDDEYGQQGATWKVATAELNWAVGAAFSVGLDLLYFGKPTETSGAGDHSGCPKTTFECYRGTVQLDGSDMTLRSLKVNVDNQYEPLRSGNSKAATAYLYPESGTIGAQVVTATGEVMVMHGEDLSGNEIPATTGNIVATAVSDADSPLTTTLTLVTPHVVSWEKAFTDNRGNKIYTVQYALDDSDDGITIACA